MGNSARQSRSKLRIPTTITRLRTNNNTKLRDAKRKNNQEQNNRDNHNNNRSNTSRGKQMIKRIGTIITSVSMGAVAQILLKIGMNSVGQISIGLELINAVFNPYVFIGLITYFLSAMIWIMALSKTDVSYAYPFASLAYVIVTILGYLILNETINTTRIIGVSVIILGVYVVSKSK